MTDHPFTVGRLWRDAKGVRLKVALRAFTGCLGVGASLLFIWVTKQIVDIVTGRSDGDLTTFTIILIGALLMQLLLPALTRRIEVTSTMAYVNAMRARLFRYLMRARWQGRDAMHTGDMINRMQNDVAVLGSLTCSTIPGMVAVLLQLVGAFVFLAVLNVSLALSVVLIMPLALAVSKIYFKRTRRYTQTIRRLDSRLHTYLQESLQHRTLISTLGATSRASEGYGALQSDLTGEIVRRSGISLFSRTVITAGFMTGYTVTFLWCADGLAAGTVTFGMMTAFLQLVAQVQRPVVDLAQRVPLFIDASVAAERIADLMALPQEDTAGIALPAGPHGLRLDDVSFAYPDGQGDVISHLSHDFCPGSITAVAGGTGAGKSTLLRLILGLVAPTGGNMWLYGADGMRVAVSASTRHGIVYVPQGNSLMSMTVRDNLRLARPDATEAEMLGAIEAAAADFVLALPDGLDTMCSEGGGGFSEGQAQRIAIARGLLRPGGIVLLDEPTSALDPATEELLMRRLSTRLRGKTVIIVTHRDATLRHCDATLRIPYQS